MLFLSYLSEPRPNLFILTIDLKTSSLATSLSMKTSSLVDTEGDERA